MKKWRNEAKERGRKGARKTQGNERKENERRRRKKKKEGKNENTDIQTNNKQINKNEEKTKRRNEGGHGESIYSRMMRKERQEGRKR